MLIRSDSQLVVSQVQRDYQAKDEQFIKYLNKVELLKKKFEEVRIEHVPREKIPGQIFWFNWHAQPSPETINQSFNLFFNNLQ